MGLRIPGLLIVTCVLLFGCGESPPTPPQASTMDPPAWVAEVLASEIGKEAADAARARLFRTEADAEVFAGLVAFAGAKDRDLRQIAAFHLASMEPVAEMCGVPVEAALRAMSEDDDEEIRRLATRSGNSFSDGVEVTAIQTGEAVLGDECAIPYPYLGGIDVHLLIRGIEFGTDSELTSFNYQAEARLSEGHLLGSAGGKYGPDLTRLSYLGIQTDDDQYGFEIWLRDLGKGRVRWWLRGLARPGGEVGGD